MRRYRLDPGVLVFAAAAALRVAWVLVRWSQAGAALEFSDEQLHWQLATNLVEHGTLVSDDGRYAARMPVYPLFLALFAWLGEVGILLARLAQALLGAATAWAVFRLADAALGRPAACVAGALACCDPYTIFFTNLLLTEVPFTLIAVGLVASAWRLIAQRSERDRLAVVGLALLGSAAVLTRPSAAGWIVLLWVVLCLLDAKRARATRRVAVCAGAVVLALVPWGLRNRAVLGSFAWLGTNGGVTLYDAQGPQAKGDSDQSFLQQMPELAGLGEVERDRALRRLAVEQMREDWGRVLQLAGVKFRRTWSLTPNVGAYSGGVAGFVSVAFMLAVLMAVVVGLWRTRRKWKLHVLLWLPVVYFTLVHCVFIGSLRYRVPLMPFVEITAAAALVSRQEPSSGPDAEPSS